MQKFNDSDGVRMVLLDKVDGDWVSKDLKINSIEEIKGSVSDDGSITQVNLDLHRKIFYSIGNLLKLEKPQIQARVLDSDGEICFMVHPLLLCECDDVKPVDLSEEVEKSIKSAIDFY